MLYFSSATMEERRNHVSLVQSAIRQREFSKLEPLINDAAEILWHPVRSCTCMHVAARCMLSEQFHGGGHPDWWQWLLETASPSDGFYTARDKSGETCFDIFFATWLNPPIGASRVFRNFETSLNVVLDSPEHLNALRDWIRYQVPNPCRQHHHSLNLPTNEHQQIIARFWRALELLCRAADLGTTDLARPCSVLHALARLNARPGPAVARLVVALFPEQAQVAPLPLHLWIAAAPSLSSSGHVTSRFRDDDDDDDGGLLVPLLETYPNAAGMLVKDCRSTRSGGRSGRYPIHVALYKGIPPRQVEHWIKANPSVLEVVDSHSKMPTWALVALTMRHETRRWARNREKRRPNVSLYDWLDSNNRQEQEQNDLDCSHLSVLYQVIRRFPHALSL